MTGKDRHRKIRKIIPIIAMLVLTACLGIALAGCGGDEEATAGPEIEGLTCTGTMTNEYAENFAIYEYEEGFRLIDVKEDSRYLVVPEGARAPGKLPEDVVVIRQAPGNIYLAATSAMALFEAIGAMDQISMTEMKEAGWSMESVRKAMRRGEIVYAGKYSQPDYELILSSGCGLAVESTMIYHTPEVREMLEELEIPVFVDRSNLESSPLGRTEWVMVYGAITGRMDEARDFFEKQKEKIAALENFTNTEKKVCFFYITSSGKVMVRSSGDYIASMIETAGGRYVPQGIEKDGGHAQVAESLETFYDQAADADILVYNTNIDDTVRSRDDLIKKSRVFENFRAVIEDSCYISGSSFYQRTDKTADMIMDLHRIVTAAPDEEPEGLEFITKME